MAEHDALGKGWRFQQAGQTGFRIAKENLHVYFSIRKMLH